MNIQSGIPDILREKCERGRQTPLWLHAGAVPGRGHRHPFFFSVSSLSPFRIIGLPHGKRTYVDGREKKKKRVNE